MVIRDNAEIRRFWRKIANAGRQALALMVCAVSLSAGGAFAAPYAQPGEAFRSWDEWAARPVIKAGLCGDGVEPCPAYEPRPYARPAHARRWEPEPYIHDDRRVIIEKPDCAEEPHLVQTHVVRETVLPHPPAELDDDVCGIKCWYKRLRAGYCGRGCDYYRFRMTQFPEGRLDTDRVRVACR